MALVAGAFWVGILLADLGEHGLGAQAAALLLLAGLVLLVILVVVGRHAAAPPAGEAAAPGWPRVVAPVVSMAMLVAAFGIMGAGWAALREAHVRGSPLARLARLGGTVRITGSMSSEPEQGVLGWTATAQVDQVAPGRPGWPALIGLHDPVWVEGHGAPPALRPGDRIEAVGALAPARGSFGAYLLHRGYAGTFSTDDIRLRGPPASPLVRMAQEFRRALRASVARVLPGREGGLLLGLALGDTSRLDPGIDEDFRATGLSHLTAVSGENVAMFLAPILGLATMLVVGRRGRLAIGLGAVGFFILLAGAEPSVLRAAVMTSLTMLGIFLGRPRSPPAILGGAVLALLALNPTLVYAIGFQLSVAATAGMALLSGPLAMRLGFLPTGLGLAAATTIGAQAGVTPLLLCHFGVVPTVSVPANLLAFVAVGPAMLLGLLAAVLGLAFRPAGLLVAGLARLPLLYLIGLADRLARSTLPSITSSGRSLPWLLLGYGIVFLAARWIHKPKAPSRRALVAIGLVLPVFVWSGAIRAGPPSALTVTFFDVGEGDSTLVTSPGGATVLVDGGPDQAQVATELAALGVRRLDVVVATHPHLDHYMGLAAVLARFPVGLVLDSGCRPPESRQPQYRQFVDAVHRERIREEHPRAGDVIRAGDLRMDVLSPDRCWEGTNSDPNNDSIVILLSYMDDAVLFANEPEAEAQQAMLETGRPLTAEVLNVPHHGAGTSIAPFLEAVHEVLAVVSVGPNRYGHPVPGILDELRRSGARVVRTDRAGDVVVSFTAGGLSVHTGKGPDLLIQSAGD
jgi:competence protein ComEC